MLTLEQIKKTLNDPSISDEEALEIRDQLHYLAELIFEKWQTDMKAGKLQPPTPDHDSSTLSR